MVRILAIDPSTQSGVVTYTEGALGYYLIRLRSIDSYRTDLLSVIYTVLVSYKPTLVLIEDFKVGSRVTSCDKSYSIRCIIRLACELLKIPYKVVNISSWKSNLLGKYSRKKEKVRLGKDYQKILVKHKLIDLGYKLPEKVLDLVNGKYYKTTYDVWDALGILRYELDNLASS